MTQGVLTKYEVPLTLGIAMLAAAWAYQIQEFQVFRYWDSDEYFLMAQQFAAGQPVTAAAPYAYRVLVPWIVGQCCGTDIQRGFLIVNLVSGIALPMLLVYWLRCFVAGAGVRVLMAAACALQWHGPLRFVFYYPAYVDPLFQALVVAALIAGERLLDRQSLAAGFAYAGLIAAGTFVRETMLIVPAGTLAGAVANRSCTRAWRFTWAALAFAAGAAAFLIARSLVEPRPGYRFLDAIALHLGNKPIDSLLLVWFISFGPVVAIVAYDWRATWAFLKQRADLAALPLSCIVLAYIGGHDTERYLFWAMPVVYLLIAQSIERHRAVVAGAAVTATLIAGQVLSQRVFWPVPDPGNAVAAMSETTDWAARLYAIANRVFVIDDFHWNLWSNFGSRPSHLVQLAFYLTVSAAIVLMMNRRAAAMHVAR